MKNEIDNLIDACGSIRQAMENRTRCIDRRRSEGKASPRAEAELAALKSLPWDYKTPAAQARGAALPHDYIS